MIEVAQVPDASLVTRLRMSRQVPGLPPYSTAAYYIDGLLIDTGCAHTARQLTAALKGWRVDQVVNTHSHEDHIGANAQVQEMSGCAILAHPQALPILQNPRLQPLQPYRRLYWGWPKSSQGGPVGEWLTMEHHRFQVIHTPGHSPDHVCLFELDQGWLFSGDAYVGGKDRALRQGYDIHGIIASLKRLAELPVQVIFSGSGTVRSNGVEPLREKIAYLEELGERICSLRDQGLSARRIRRRVFGREPALTYATLGHFSGLRLVKSYLAAPPAPEAVQEAVDTAQKPETDEAPASDQTGE